MSFSLNFTAQGWPGGGAAPRLLLPINNTSRLAPRTNYIPRNNPSFLHLSSITSTRQPARRPLRSTLTQPMLPRWPVLSPGRATDRHFDGPSQAPPRPPLPPAATAYPSICREFPCALLAYEASLLLPAECYVSRCFKIQQKRIKKGIEN